MKNKKLCFIFIGSTLFVIITLLLLFYNIPRLSYVYIEEENAYAVAKLYGNKSLVSIPREYKNKPVVSINERAFKNSKIKKIIFEEDSNVRQIGKQAFYNCNKLQEIDLPSSVEIVNQNCFAYCSSLTSFKVKENSKLTSICGSMFFKDINLSRVDIPKSVELIGSYAFFECYSLKELTIVEEATIYQYAFYGCDLTLYMNPLVLCKEDWDYNASINKEYLDNE